MGAVIVLQSAIPALIPTVPIVLRGGVHDLELRIGRASASHHGLPGINPLRSLWSEHLHVAGASRDLGLGGFRDANAEDPLVRRTGRNARGIQLNVRLRLPHYPISHRAASNLDVVSPVLQHRQVDFGIAAYSQDVSRVELNFRARILASGDTVVRHQRSVDYAGDPFSRIAAPYRNLAIHQADTGHTAAQIFRRRGLRPRRNRRSHSQKQRARRK